MARTKRYRVADRDGAPALVCGNSPNIALRIERGLTVDSRGRKRYPAQTIFLDGVYNGAPFYDNEARHYSLDHHAGCVRAFTLATCEQAVVMLLQGLPLSSGNWNVYVNDPDLDSLLASWVLLNHMELLRDECALLKKSMPLIRLEGVIDAHGTDKVMLSAMPKDLYDRTKSQLDALLAEEMNIKKAGEWMTADWFEYAASAFEAVDDLIYPDGALDELLEIQETGRVVLYNDRIALMVESSLGIYEVESRLKKRYGIKLGVIVLKAAEDRYTIRLVDNFLPRNLEAVYKALNRADPLARTGSEPNLWGGSGDIGGSPRLMGTGLSEDEMLEVIREVLGERKGFFRRLFGFLFRSKKPRHRALTAGEK